MSAFQHYWSSRRARATLLAGTALTGRVLRALVPPTLPTLAASAVVLAVVPPIFGVGGMSARADDVGGSGGLGPSRNNGVAPGGAGGTATHSAGYNGTTGDRYNRSGGGGGGGAIGGLGGNGGAAFNGAAGGLGGATAGANGGTGVQGSEAGGGGGGGAGGANPASVVTLSNSATVTGQAGGHGGNGAFGTGFLNSAGGGGGGGAGAYGAIVTGGGLSSNGASGVITGGAGGYGGNGGSGGSTNNGGQAGNGGGGGIGVQFTSAATGATFTNAGQIKGGAGGNGGNGGYRFGAGYGGNGGIGLQLGAGGIGVTNTGMITGGVGGSGSIGGTGGVGVLATLGGTITNAGGTIAGGAGGALRGSGTAGSGGVGIMGAGLSIVNAGKIKGGLSGDGTTYADAIVFTGGTNSLEIDPGSMIVGNVVGTGSDTFKLGGTTTGNSFDISTIGAGQQYSGFDTLQKVGSGTWTITGIGTYSGATTITAGTLALSGDASIASSSGVTLATGGTFDISGNGATSIASLTDTATGQAGAVTLGGNTLTITAATGTFSGAISGMGGSLVLQAGTQTLAGTDTYTGTTSVTGGTLIVDSGGSLTQTSSVTVDGGTLTIQNSGGTTNGGGLVAISGGGLVIGQTAGTSAAPTSSSVTITGSGSTLSFINPSNSNIGLGEAAYAGASLTVSAGGTISGSSDVIIGAAAQETSNATVTGAGSSWEINHQILVGNSGTGTLTVSAGGLVNADSSYGFNDDYPVLGVAAGSSGTVTVTGTGSTFETAYSTLAVGQDGTGVLTVANGGTVKVGSTGAGTIDLAQNGDATGTLVIGAAPGSAATAAGTVDAATIQFGSGTGTVVFNITDTAYTFAPTIQGAGSVDVEAGHTTFTAVDGYSGATTINGGTLALSGGASIASSSGVALATGGTFDISGNGATSIASLTDTATGQAGAVALGGNALTITAATGIFSGAISGVGGSLVLQAGTQTLAGTNTYTGATTIGGGTLVGGIANAVSRSSGVIIGTAGTFDLGGFAQTIASLADGTTGGGTITNNGTSNATLTIDGGTATTFSGAITDGKTQTTGLALTGGSSLVLNGTSTYGGATTVAAGSSLELYAGHITRSASLTNAGLFEVASGASATFAGAVTTTGTIDVEGQFTSGPITVEAGGTLTGGGTIGDPIIAAGATLAPTGTMTIVGPLSFAQGSYFNVSVTPTTNDFVSVTGATTIAGGTVRVTAGGTSYLPQNRYTILTSSAGVSGTFSGVTSNYAFLTPTLSYDPNDVFLILSRNDVSFKSVASTPNQAGAAKGLTNAARSTVGVSGGQILNAFYSLSVPQAQSAFDSISGEGIAAAQNTAFGSTSLFISSIFDQTTFYGGDGGSANQITLTAPQPGFSAYAPAGDASFTRTPIHELADLPSTAAPIPAPVFAPQRTWRAWATGFGGVEDFSGNGVVGSAGQSDSIYGGTLGIDYQLMPNYLAGLAIGGSNGDFSVPGRATSGSTTGGHVAFYDLATFGAFYAASTTSASFYSNQTTRTIAGFGGLGGETDRGNFRSNAYSSKVEFGRHFSAYGGLITPFASIELTDLRSYGFTETALSGPGLFALNVQGQDTASVPSLVGARFQTVLPLGNGLVLSPSLQVAWEHQFSPQRPVLAGLINLPGAVFLTNGASPARDSAAVKAGGELAIGKQAALFANFDGDFSGVDRFYGGKGGFKYVW